MTNTVKAVHRQDQAEGHVKKEHKWMKGDIIINELGV